MVFNRFFTGVVCFLFFLVVAGSPLYSMKVEATGGIAVSEDEKKFRGKQICLDESVPLYSVDLGDENYSLRAYSVYRLLEKTEKFLSDVFYYKKKDPILLTGVKDSNCCNTLFTDEKSLKHFMYCSCRLSSVDAVDSYLSGVIDLFFDAELHETFQRVNDPELRDRFEQGVFTFAETVTVLNKKIKRNKNDEFVFVYNSAGGLFSSFLLLNRLVKNFNLKNVTVIFIDGEYQAFCKSGPSKASFTDIYKSTIKEDVVGKSVLGGEYYRSWQFDQNDYSSMYGDIFTQFMRWFKSVYKDVTCKYVIYQDVNDYIADCSHNYISKADVFCSEVVFADLTSVDLFLRGYEFALKDNGVYGGFYHHCSDEFLLDDVRRCLMVERFKGPIFYVPFACDADFCITVPESDVQVDTFQQRLKNGILNGSTGCLFGIKGGGSVLRDFCENALYRRLIAQGVSPSDILS